jgi:hypothetical protein
MLFMKIDADAGGTVDWNEFMNYMLLENQTLSSMKQETFRYENPSKPDVKVGKGSVQHNKDLHLKNITSILILYPEMLEDSSRPTGQFEKGGSCAPGSPEYKRMIKYVTGS